MPKAYSDINKLVSSWRMDEETHQRYRVRSSLEKAHKNLYELIELNKNPQSNVQIDVGLIVMRHNEHQVNEF